MIKFCYQLLEWLSSPGYTVCQALPPPPEEAFGKETTGSVQQKQMTDDERMRDSPVEMTQSGHGGSSSHGVVGGGGRGVEEGGYQLPRASHWRLCDAELDPSWLNQRCTPLPPSQEKGLWSHLCSSGPGCGPSA